MQDNIPISGSAGETAEQQYASDMQKFYNNEYAKALGLDSVKDKAVRERLRDSDLRFWSHKNRIVHNIQILKHTFLMNKTSIITTCFKATLKGTSCIYGYMYSRHRPNPKGPGEIENVYICGSPTYRSQDGEYRHRVLPYHQFEALWSKYYDVFEPVESLILQKMNAGALEFQTDFYYPAGFTYSERKFENMIDESRVLIKLLTICWFSDFHYIHNRIIENHINPAYQYVIYQANDVPVYEGIIQKIGSTEYVRICHRICRYYPRIDGPDTNLDEVECGQKIFPITIFEAIKQDDINFNVWREIYFTNMCSNLVINLISPSFPFINGWFYIQNAHEGLFDNLAMHEKYRHSDIATDISNQLKNVDKFNYVKNDMAQGPVNNRFMRLSKYIQRSIVYVDSAIKLTDLAICMTSEYVGRTLRDLPILISQRQDLFPHSLLLAFTDIDVFTKHLFEFVYGFYCMNTKAGLFHGDLHMNNATICKLYAIFDRAGNVHSSAKNPHVAYIVSPTETYLFPHYGAYSMIIDYSRAVMGNFAKLEHEFGTRYAEHYFKEQRFRVMQIIYHYFPKVMAKYREKIEGLLISNFTLMFKILTAVDTFVICSNIAAMLTIDETFTKGKVKLATGTGKILVRLIQNAEHLIVSNIQDAVNGKIRDPGDIEWPNLVILRQCFEDYAVTGESIKKYKDTTILDIFNYNNEVKHDIEDYTTWGPLLSLDKEIELRKKYGLELHKGIKDWLEFKETDESLMIEQLVSKYEQQEKDLIHFESWMLL